MATHAFRVSSPGQAMGYAGEDRGVGAPPHSCVVFGVWEVSQGFLDDVRERILELCAHEMGEPSPLGRDALDGDGTRNECEWHMPGQAQAHVIIGFCSKSLIEVTDPLEHLAARQTGVKLTEML